MRTRVGTAYCKPVYLLQCTVHNSGRGGGRRRRSSLRCRTLSSLHRKPLSNSSAASRAAVASQGHDGIGF